LTRIAYLTSRYPAVSHTFVLREARALRRLGLEIETATVRRAEPAELLSALDREEDATTYAILPSSPGRVVAAHLLAFARRPRRYMDTLRLALGLGGGGLRGLVWRTFYFGEAILFARWCRKRRVGHVHVHFANVAADVALLAAHYGEGGRGASSWSFTMHGPTEFGDAAGHRLASKVERARFVICISDFCRSQLMALVDREHWRKLRIVHCGVDPERFAPADGPQAAGQPLQVLTVGRLVSVKGQAVLIEAIAELARRRRDAQLTLVGDGPDRARLEALVSRLGIRDLVRFAGVVAQTETPGWYARADVFCLPSFAEGVPVVLMEAMATGLPVVTTPIAGIPELVEDEVSGILVPPGRVDALADALAALADAPERRRAMGEAGRRRVMEDFDTDRSALRLRRILLEELASDRGRSDARTADAALTGSR
jgi:glycosyltransferase involved in cell wall biosynthesis